MKSRAGLARKSKYDKQDICKLNSYPAQETCKDLILLRVKIQKFLGSDKKGKRLNPFHNHEYNDSFCGKSILEKGTTKSNAISVEQYDEDLDLQLALMTSHLQTNPPTEDKCIDLSQGKIPFRHEADNEIRVLWFNSPNTRKKLKNALCRSFGARKWAVFKFQEQPHLSFLKSAWNPSLEMSHFASKAVAMFTAPSAWP
ncbi:hypothetical protein PanWU01x14_112940, partial [Parasponia andersonii]